VIAARSPIRIVFLLFVCVTLGCGPGVPQVATDSMPHEEIVAILSELEVGDRIYIELYDGGIASGTLSELSYVDIVITTGPRYKQKVYGPFRTCDISYIELVKARGDSSRMKDRHPDARY
jgi:hypothetical protein